MPDQSFGGVPVILTATSSAGLPVSFSVVTGPATISGAVLTLTAAGIVTVRASQAGNWAYNAAVPVERTFSAGKATQQIAWTAIDDQIYGGAPLMLHAQATSGQAVVFSVISGPATVTGNQCTLTGQGEVVLRAVQSGNANYFALSSDIFFTVLGAPQTISFGALAQQLVGASAFPLAGTSSSGFPLTFSVVNGPAVIIEGLLHVTGPGLVIVRASADGSTTVAPAYVEQAFAVVPGVNIITDQQALESGSGYFRFWGEQGRLYEIERSNNLQSWMTEETLTVNGLGYIDYIHDLPTGGQKLFYRVKEAGVPPVTGGGAFQDDFNRVDAPAAGNGWIGAVGAAGAGWGDEQTLNGQLAVVGQQLLNLSNSGFAAVYRPAVFASGLHLEATFSDKSGGGGSRNRHDHFLGMRRTPKFGPGAKL